VLTLSQVGAIAHCRVLDVNRSASQLSRRAWS
jgi:hypothetical protein